MSGDDELQSPKRPKACGTCFFTRYRNARRQTCRHIRIAEDILRSATSSVRLCRLWRCKQFRITWPSTQVTSESLVINIRSELEPATCARLPSFEDQTVMASFLDLSLYIIKTGIYCSSRQSLQLFADCET